MLNVIIINTVSVHMNLKRYEQDKKIIDINTGKTDELFFRGIRAGSIIVKLENRRDTSKKLLELIWGLYKVGGYKTNT